MYYAKQWIGERFTNFPPYKRRGSAIKDAERLLLNELVEKVEIIEVPNKFGEGKEFVVSTILRG